MPDTLLHTDQITILEEKILRNYATDISLLMDWSESNSYTASLIWQIEKLIKDKQDGHLKDDDNVPEVSEITSALGNRYQTAKIDLESFTNAVEVSGAAFTEALQNPAVLLEIRRMSTASRLAKKALYLEFLLHSESGKGYLRECMAYDGAITSHPERGPMSPESPYLFNFAELEVDLIEAHGAYEKARQGPGADLGGASSALMDFLKGIYLLLPEYHKHTVVVTESYTRFMVRFTNIFVVTSPIDPNQGVQALTLKLEEVYFERSSMQYRKTVKIKNVFKEDLGHLFNRVKLAVTVVQFLVSVKALKDSPDFKKGVGFIGSLASLIDDATNLYIESLKSGAAKVKFERTALGRVSKVAGGVGTYAISPLQFCFALDDFAVSILEGDSRAAWNAGVSAAGAIVGIVVGLIGGATGIGLLVGVAVVLIGLIWQGEFNSGQKNALLVWLDRNYYSKNFDVTATTPPAWNNGPPTEIGFEWWKNGETFEGIKREQVRSLYSILNPINVSISSSFWTHESTTAFTITLSTPMVAPGDFLIRIRFFDQRGKEVTNARFDVASTEKGVGEDGMLVVPVSLDGSTLPTSRWKAQHPWFSSHEIKTVKDPNDSTSIKGIEEYTLIVKQHLSARARIDYCQVQIIPMDREKKILQPGVDLLAYINGNPFIHVETKHHHRK